MCELRLDAFQESETAIGVFGRTDTEGLPTGSNAPVGLDLHGLGELCFLLGLVSRLCAERPSVAGLQHVGSAEHQGPVS